MPDLSPQVRWFGETWHSPINSDTTWAPTPVDDTCIYCAVPIKMGDQGILMRDFGYMRVPVHIGCLLNMIGMGRYEGGTH